MREITRTEPAPVAAAPRRRPRWGLVAIPVAVAAAATAVVLNVTGSASPSAPSVAIAPVVKVLPASAQGTTELMQQVAAATGAGRHLTIRPDQYVYVRSEVGFSRQVAQRTMDGLIRMDAVHEREVWLPEDPTRSRADP
ncbi:hypothetical protein [Streptomyces sp. NPDC059909]|uniref:hypothetical protein n=1 Tax=Streptomyces sp. NPDC059909 TaxID=3346998 RepID=UPI00364E3BE6